ncbi:MAG: ribonuclease PH [Acidimicrobiia bacterium]
MDTPTTPAPSGLRSDGRKPDQLREVVIERDFTDMTPGSVLISFGRTRVLCTASVEDSVPRWRRDSGLGWVTAEYSMLPGSTADRKRRERNGAGGRTKEIERLVGRSLRAVVDMTLLADRSVYLDCDVLQADGGTRTAAITGAWVALHDACARLVADGRIEANPVVGQCAAVSVGVVDGRAVLDLPYVEDANAETDMNVVMTGDGRFVEVQGTAEGVAFDRSELDALLDLAVAGCTELFAKQRVALGITSGAIT